MSVVYIMIPLTLLLALGAVLSFIWAARTGQYDEIDSAAARMVVEDDGDGVVGEVEGLTRGG